MLASAAGWWMLAGMAMAGQAVFLGEDRVVRGNWHNVYGTDGMCGAPGDRTDPAYATLSFSGEATGTWAADAGTDIRAPQVRNGGGRSAARWHSSTSFDLDIGAAAAKEYRLSLYCLDWADAGISQTVEIRDAATDAVLDTRVAAGFRDGAYYRWNVSGGVKVRVIAGGAGSSAVSGVYFDPVVENPAWWAEGQPPGSGNPPAILPGAAVDNHAVATVGQAKWMARSALAALGALEPEIAARIEQDLVGPGRPVAAWDPPLLAAGLQAQRSPLVLGQLKAIARPFYDHLHAVNPGWLQAQMVANGTVQAGMYRYPWTAATGDDDATSPATIGQMKAVFALRFDEGLDGLLAHWTLDQKSGALQDGAGDQDLTPHGAPAAQGGINGMGSYLFDGADDRMEGGTAELPVLDVGCHSLSVSLWFRTSSGGTGLMLGKGEAFRLSIGEPGAGRVAFALDAGDPASAVMVNTVDSFHDGEWHHLAAVCDPVSGRARIYVDGMLQVLEKHAGSSGTSTEGGKALDFSGGPALEIVSAEPVALGHGPGSTGWYAGGLDDVRIYGRALSAAEVSALHQMDQNLNGVADDIEAVDSDDDGLPDYWERLIIERHTGSPALTLADVLPAGDDDGDGVPNSVEYAAGLLPYLPDTDGDGYSDLLSVDNELDLRLDESEGTLAGDESGKSRHGTLAGSPVWNPAGGVEGGAIHLQSAGDAVLLPAATLDGRADFTVAVWLRAATATGDRTLLSGTGSGGGDIAIKLQGQDEVVLTIGTATPAVWDAGRDLSDGRWHLLVVGRDASAGEARLSIDGAPHPDAKTVPSADLGTVHVVAGQLVTSGGGFTSGSGFTGYLDGIRVYSTVLPDSAVEELFRPNDQDADGIPDDYEREATGGLTHLGGGDADGDGVPDLPEYLTGGDPLDYHNGALPMITLISGGGQTVFNGSTTASPIVFQVTRAGIPLPEVPVTLENLERNGLLKLPGRGEFAVPATLKTDSEGKISLFFKAN